MVRPGVTGDKKTAEAELAMIETAAAAHRANAVTSDFISAITRKTVATKPTVRAFFEQYTTRTRD